MPSTSCAISPAMADERVFPLLIALGANLRRTCADGTRTSPAETLRAAFRELATGGLVIEAASTIYRTPPIGGPESQPPYANQVIAGRFSGSPADALDLLMEIERRFGRKRTGAARHAPRTLDLDLLDFAGRVLPDCATWHRAADSEMPAVPLILPHPRMHQRAFVLVPLAEIRADWRHPVLGVSACDLLKALDPADRAAIHPWPMDCGKA